MSKVSGKGQAAILNDEQISSIINLCREPYRYPVAIAAYTGCRMGEAIKLRAENIHWNAKQITLTKTKSGKARTIDMHPALVELLSHANLPTEGYLFPSSRSAGHISRQIVDKELREVCEAFELEGVGTHSFRRSLATKLHSQGIPLKVIAEITGHDSLSNLSLYIDVSPESKRSAILGAF
jgi:integrase/recombinase XerD